MNFHLFKCIFFGIFLFSSCSNINENRFTSKVVIVQPIITKSDSGDKPARMEISSSLINNAYSKADLSFHFLEPIYLNNTKARDGKINLDSIVEIAKREKILRGQNDIINMFFVNAIDGNKGATGRGMMNGNLIFISLGKGNEYKEDEKKYMEAFVAAHEIGHNLGLKHAFDDPNVKDSIPNIQGEGDFKDRIDPKYSLSDYQIKEIYMSPLVHSRINFLNKKQASIAILDETFEPYFSKLQPREITTFVQEKSPTSIDSARNFARKKFSSAVLEFSDKEKKIISFVVNKTNHWLRKNEINLMANHPWRFIKIQNWLCGGFAHTRGTYIILSQSYLDRLTKDWSDEMSKKNEASLVTGLGGLLVHEQLHSLQRTFPSKFNRLYSNKWNFINANVNDENQIIINQVSNPDAPIAQWLIPIEEYQNKFYWVRTLLKKNIEIPIMGKHFEDVAFEVEKKEGEFYVSKTNSVLKSKPLSEIDFYKKSFPVKRGLDHPNEISAYMFSEFFKAEFNLKQPFEKAIGIANKNAEQFMEWIKTEMN